MKKLSKTVTEKITTNAAIGPFNHPIHLDIRPLTVFIGPQGTGKSLLSQFLYLFRDAKHLLANLPDRKSPEDAIRKIVEGVRAGDKSYRAFMPFIHENVHLGYTCANNTVEKEISFLKNKYEIKPIYHFRKEVKSWLKEFAKPTSVSQVQRQALFIPAERTFVSHLINAAPGLLGNAALPLGTRHFIDFLSVDVAEVHKKWRVPSSKRPPEAKKIADLVTHELGGHAICEGNGGFRDNWKFVPTESESPIEMEMASSGQMDTWPLVASMQAIFDKDSSQRPAYIHIEEPETHLHPSTQAALVNMLGYLINKGFHIVITTHSMVIAYAINNLIMATLKLGEKQAESMPSPEIRIQPEQVSAYLFNDGCVEDIYEDHQIDEGLLGEVLDSLEVQFNHMMTYNKLWS